MKVLTIVGTRPEIIKLSRVIDALDRSVDHVLVHTGQNYDYELNQVFFDDLEIRKPDYFLNAAGETTAESIANIIKESDKVLEKESPDALLIYGDTNSCLSVIAAKRRKIPIFHMEAGNRCFDQRVPEEINRKIVDHLSDINMVISDHARRYLMLEGIKPETIIKIGSSMKEVFDYYKTNIEESDVLQREKLDKNGYFLVSIHREENVESVENFENLRESLNEIVKEFKKRIIISTHPRTKKKMGEIGFTNNNEMISFMKPFGFFDYIKLQKNAYCVISDSGTVSEESSLLNFPAVMVRQAHERLEAMDAGTLIMTGLNKTHIINSIKVTRDIFEDIKAKHQIVQDYNISNISSKVIKIIMSYKSYVNRTVWRKNDI